MWDDIQLASMLKGHNMGKRPDHVKPPAYLSKSPPVPQPDPLDKDIAEGEMNPENPTRYGDWERKGIAIDRSDEHTSELQSLMRISYAVFCLNTKKHHRDHQRTPNINTQQRKS